MVGVIFSLMARLIHGRNEQGERPWQKTLLWAALHSPAGQAGPDGGWTENRPEQGGRPGDAGAQPGGKGRLCWACSITSTQGEAGRRGREHSPLLQRIPRTPPCTVPPGGSQLRPRGVRGVAAPSTRQPTLGACLTLGLWALGTPSRPQKGGSRPAWSRTGHFQRRCVTNNYNAAKLHVKYTFSYADIKGFFRFHVEIL